MNKFAIAVKEKSRRMSTLRIRVGEKTPEL